MQQNNIEDTEICCGDFEIYLDVLNDPLYACCSCQQAVAQCHFFRLSMHAKPLSLR